MNKKILLCASVICFINSYNIESAAVKTESHAGSFSFILPKEFPTVPTKINIESQTALEAIEKLRSAITTASVKIQTEDAQKIIGSFTEIVTSLPANLQHNLKPLIEQLKSMPILDPEAIRKSMAPLMDQFQKALESGALMKIEPENLEAIVEHSNITR